ELSKQHKSRIYKSKPKGVNAAHKVYRKKDPPNKDDKTLNSNTNINNNNHNTNNNRNFKSNNEWKFVKKDTNVNNKTVNNINSNTNNTLLLVKCNVNGKDVGALVDSGT